MSQFCSKMAIFLFSAYFGGHFCYYSNRKSQINAGLLHFGYYLRRFSESRSSSGSTPSVRSSVRLSVRPSVRPSIRPSVCPSVRNTLGCQVCVICNSKSCHSFLFKLCLMIVHILKMCTSYFVHVSKKISHF